MSGSRLVQPAYFSLTELARYSGLSVRTLRAHLADPCRPLPHYRIGGRVLVRPSDYDDWASAFRSRQQRSLNDLVSEIVGDLG